MFPTVRVIWTILDLNLLASVLGTHMHFVPFQYHPPPVFVMTVSHILNILPGSSHSQLLPRS